MGIVPHLLSAGYAVSFCKCQNNLNNPGPPKGIPLSHYNLYESLNLDSSASSNEIVSVLDTRIQEGNLDNLGGIEEVKLAKQILGDFEKRAKYDARLADPTAPDITVDTIRDLAALGAGASNAANANAQHQDAPRARGFNSQISPEKVAAVKNSFNTAAAGASERARDVQAEYKKSSRTAIIITAIGAFVAGGLIVGLVGSMFGGGTVASTGADYKGAEKFANSFLELRQADETREWIIENADAGDRGSMLERLGVGEGSRYTGMDGYFGNNEMTAGKPISVTEFVRSAFDSVDSYAEEFGDPNSGGDNTPEILSEASLGYMFGDSSMDLDPEKEYFVVPIIGDSKYGEGSLSVVKDGNNWVLESFSLG